MGPLRNTDFYGIHFAYLIENNSGSVLNGISIATYGNAELCNGLQLGLLLNESNANGWQFGIIGNQASYCADGSSGSSPGKELTGLQTAFQLLTENRDTDLARMPTGAEKNGSFQIGFVNQSAESAIQDRISQISLPKVFVHQLD